MTLRKKNYIIVEREKSVLMEIPPIHEEGNSVGKMRLYYHYNPSSTPEKKNSTGVLHKNVK